MTPVIQIPLGRRPLAGFAILLSLLCALSFGNLLSHPFNAIGDEQETLHDLRILDRYPERLFSPERQSPIRPALDITLMLAYKLWGDNPTGYRLLQIGLHGLAAFLLVLFLEALGADRELAFASALLFLLNVAHFRALQWIICINYVLALVCVLLTVQFFLRALNRTIWVLPAALAMAAAVFSHPSSIAAAPFCVYLSWRARLPRRATVRFGGFVLFYSSVLGMAVYLFSPRVEEVTGLLSHPEASRLLLNPLWYLGRLAASAHWLAPLGIGNAYTPLEIVLGLFLLLMAWALLRRRITPAADAAVWMVLMVLPFLNNAIGRLTVGPSRQLYAASAGFSILLAWALRALLVKRLPRTLIRPLWLVSLGGICLLSGFSLKRAEALDLWLVGRSHVAAGRYGEGIDLFERAVSRAPGLIPSETYYSWVSLLAAEGMSPTRILTRALARRPDSPDLRFLMALSRVLVPGVESDRKGRSRMNAALAESDDPARMRYGGSLVCHNWGRHHQQFGRLEDAADGFALALDLKPDYPAAKFRLGQVKAQSGDRTAGARLMAEAILEEPERLEDLIETGDASYRAGRLDEAEWTYRFALEQQPARNDLRSRLAWVLSEQGRGESALFLLEEALEREPDNATVWFLVAQIRRSRGEVEAAGRAIEKARSLAPDLPGLRTFDSPPEMPP